MIKISQDQALARWDTLPTKLREALYSDMNSDFLWRTCEAEHIPKEKIYNISAIAGYVLLGFLHPGDVAQELKDLGIVPQVADTVSAAINKRVFDPVRIDLEKIYEPPSTLTLKPIVEIKFPATAPSPAAIPGTPKPFEIKISGAPLPSIPLGEIKTPAAPSSPLPMITPPFKTGVPGTPSMIKQEIKQPGSLGTIGSEPPPTILHEEPLAPSSKSTQEFKIEIPQPKLSEMKPATMAPTKPAVLELGSSPLKTLEGGEAKTSDKVRVVHYTEMRTPLGKVPAPMSPIMQGREIKEITAAPIPQERIEPPRTVLPSKPPIITPAVPKTSIPPPPPPISSKPPTPGAPKPPTPPQIPPRTTI